MSSSETANLLGRRKGLIFAYCQNELVWCSANLGRLNHFMYVGYYCHEDIYRFQDSMKQGSDMKAEDNIYEQHRTFCFNTNYFCTFGLLNDNSMK